MQQYHVSEDKLWFTKEAGWPEYVPKNYDFPNITVGKMLDNVVKKHLNNRAVWFIDTWMTYRELAANVDAFATALHNLGVRKGDCVAFLLPNSFQYVIAYYAVMKLGAIVSGCNPTYKPMEILHQFKTIGAKALITLDALYEPIVKPIIDETDIEIIIGTNVVDLADLSPIKKFLGKKLKDKETGDKMIPSGKLPKKALKFKKLLKTKPNVPSVKIAPQKDPATYIMTGGTTGVPKAAILTHSNIVSNAIQCKLWLPEEVQDGACNVGVLPLFHSFAMTAVMNASIASGMWMMLFPRPPKTPELLDHFERLINEDEGAFYCGAEILFKRLADYPDIHKFDLAGKLTCCISGAGPLHRPVQEKFEKLTKARLVEGYGLTEATPVVSCNPFFGERVIGTIGLPFPGTTWRIVDLKNPKKDLGHAKGANPSEDEVKALTGEIAVHGPQVMKGYLNQPKETKETLVKLDKNIWLLTGDIGYMDHCGRIIILDRKKQLIKYKGYSVFPKEIEELVGGHPAVDEVAAAGLPHEEYGEAIKVWVVLDKAHKGKLTTEELKQWCKENLTHYKVPSYIEFREDVPKSLVGKVQRRQLQEADPLYKKAMKK